MSHQGNDGSAGRKMERKRTVVYLKLVVVIRKLKAKLTGTIELISSPDSRIADKIPRGITSTKSQGVNLDRTNSGNSGHRDWLID